MCDLSESIMAKPITVKFEDMPDYLEENNLQIEPGSIRWEPDPKRPGRLRLAVNLIQKTSETDTE